MPERDLTSKMTESAYVILLASCEPLHGYGIMQKVKEMTQEGIIVGPGTLYGVIKKLMAQGWMAMTTQGDQKIYKTTDVGKEQLLAEIERLENMAAIGREVLK